MVGLAVGDSLVGLAGLREVSEACLLNLSEAQSIGELRVAVAGARRDLDLLGEQSREVLVAAGFFVERGEKERRVL